MVVYAHIIKSARSAATLALPTQVLGNEYIAPSMNSESTQGSSGNGTIGGVSEITVVATLPNTQVTIVPTAGGRNGEKAGTPIPVTLLNAGDCYQFQSANLGDLSGTKITSSPAAGSTGCKPIAVFSATTWSAFDCTNSSGGDNLYQMLFPTKSWGKTFVTAPFINRPSDIFRILVQNANAVVQIQENGVTTTLGAANFNAAGKYYTYKTNNPIIITGSEPISVAQYITSETCKNGCFNNSTIPTCYADPEMVILSPVEQTLQDITFFSAHKDYVPANQTQVVLHFVNIIVSKNFKNSVKIDNAAPKGSFVDIPGSNFSYLQEDLTSSSAANPIHHVVADTNFSAIVYGYGNVESYGYNGGTNVKDFTPSATFQNPYNRIDSAVTCVNTPLQFSVPLNFTPATIVWDFSGAPNISPNANINQSSGLVADSTKIINGQTIGYYSTKQTYSFSKANTVNTRDIIKLLTTTSAPDGCGSTSQTLSIPIKVNDQPIAQFNITNGGCVSDSLQLIDQSTIGIGSLARWLWNFGDNTTDDRNSNAPFNKKYVAAGAYTIKLKAISDIGCISVEVAKSITLTDKPTAKFNFPAVACANSDILFTDASTAASGKITKWTWNLDDGTGAFSNATNASVKANYAVYGNKNPSLQVELDNGCKSNVYLPSPQLIINPIPEVGFISPAICLNDANALFTDTTKIADGSGNFSYVWNFNAGSPAVSPGPNIISSTQKNPQVTYKKSDNYVVSLTVTSVKGCVASKTQSFTVNGTTPKAGFEILNALPLCGIKPIQLKNNSTVDFGNLTKLEIDWDIINNPAIQTNDLLPSFGKTYLHAYPNSTLPSAITYQIKLSAYSGGTSCVDRITKSIQVYPQPLAAFSVSNPQLCSGELINFQDSSNGVSSAINNWVWNLGNNDITGLQNPSKRYTDSGLVTVSMYFYNKDGCISDTASKQLTIYPNPKLQLQHSITALSGGSVALIPLYVYGNELQYLWSPATYLTSDTAAIPISIPQDDITYTLKLSGKGGCFVTDTTFIRVLKGPEVPNAFSPNGDGINDVWKIKYLEFYPGAVIQVYNRFGQVVFSKVGYDKEWDGTYNGSPLPVGTYYYVINPKNGRSIISGAITIIK